MSNIYKRRFARSNKYVVLRFIVTLILNMKPVLNSMIPYTIISYYDEKTFGNDYREYQININIT